jgi:peptidoglycan/LPS O-acetylase OafA/YrhL
MDLALELSPEMFTYLRLGYIVGGLLCLALATVGFGQTVGNRVVNTLIGLACLAYAAYLYVSDPSTVWIFPYVLLLPVIVLFQAISNGVKSRQRQGA